MAKILLINTAFEKATVSISVDEEIILEAESNSQKDHAFFLEPSIKKISETSSLSLHNLDAIAVINGPGSYTGLRVGLSSAKALCYALNKPLILLNSLDVMAHALKLKVSNAFQPLLFCPLIDARRMEVYTALYNFDLQLVKNYSSEIINENFLLEERNRFKIICGGSGSLKLQQLTADDQFNFINSLQLSAPAASMAESLFIGGKFAELAYSEPFYLKQAYFRK